VGQVGRKLAEFLRHHPDPERPDLADLAERWSRQEVFFATPAEPVGVEAFAGLDQEAFKRKSLALSPALRILILNHAAARLWRQLEDWTPPDPPVATTSAVAVWRSGFQVVHSTLPLDEAVALEGARSGASLAAICAAFTDRADPAVAAHETLTSWLAEGWITRVADRLSTRLDQCPVRPAPAWAGTPSG
jgi:hypothetical protein